jgi:hypothetical protein
LAIDNDLIENHIAGLSNRDRRDYSVIDIDQWIGESQSFLGQLYAIENKVVNDQYILNAKPIIESRLARAVLRLQRVFEMYF